MALVKATPQLLVETGPGGGLGYESEGRRIRVSDSNNLAAELSAQTSSVTASRDLQLTDNGMVLNCNSGSAIVLTISPASSVVWSGVSCVAIYQAGAGASSFAAGSGVTLRGTPPTPAQYATHAIMRVGVNEWAYL